MIRQQQFVPLDVDLVVTAADEYESGYHFKRLIPSLQKMGARITYVGWDRSKRLPQSFSTNGIEHRMIFRGFGYSNWKLAIGIPLWVMRLWLYLLLHRPKFVFAIDFDAGLSAAVAGLFTHRPFIYEIRDNFAMRHTLPKMARPLVSWLDRWVIRRAAKVFVPDESRIESSDTAVREKYVIIHNCTPDVTPKAPQTEKRPFTVLATGYLMKTRGIHLLLEAAERLPDIQIVIAGAVREQEIERKIRQTPNATFLGWLPYEEALQLYFQADIVFAFYDPSSEINRKAASSKWSDAMMAARPILVNSELINSQWIKEHEMGFLCPYGDKNALIEMLKYLRDHPEEIRQKGANGRRLYEAGFNWPAMEKRIYDVLVKFVANRSKVG